jgi:orotate phosphoribosyltransferase
VSGQSVERLLERLRRDAYRAGTFTLASGKTSDFFIDCKRVVLTAEGHVLVGESMLAAIERFESGANVQPIASVAGVALGGCPLASAVSLTSQLRGRPRDALYVRKEAKDHGTRALVEGVTPEGARVALLEDVLTTGGSSRAAIDRLREAGLVVPLVVALVDRREGGVEALRAHGVDVIALFRREDFVR